MTVRETVILFTSLHIRTPETPKVCASLWILAVACIHIWGTWVTLKPLRIIKYLDLARVYSSEVFPDIEIENQTRQINEQRTTTTKTTKPSWTHTSHPNKVVGKEIDLAIN